MTEPRCNHSKPGNPPHGKVLERHPDNFCYVFDGQDLILAWAMCPDHKPVWWESEAYRTRIPPIPLEQVPLPKPRRLKPLTVDGRIRNILKKLVEAKMLKPEQVPGFDNASGPLPKPTRDYYYWLEEQGLIPDRFLLAS